MNQFWTRVYAFLQRARGGIRARIVAEVSKVEGLMSLLMKQRNGRRWTPEDLRKIQLSLHHLTAISSLFFVFLLPGSFAFLPPLAWWLDRRKHKRGIERNMVAG